MVEQAQKARVEAQYYTSPIIRDPFQDEFSQFCPRFVVKCKQICEGLTESEIHALREILANHRKGSSH